MFVNTQISRSRTRNFSLFCNTLGSFSCRASHGSDVCIGSVSAFTETSRGSSSQSPLSAGTRSAPRPRAADVRPALDIAALEQSFQAAPKSPDFQDAFARNSILLPFTARLGHQPTSIVQREAAKVRTQVRGGGGESSAVHAGRDDAQQQCGSIAVHECSAGDVCVQPQPTLQHSKSRCPGALQCDTKQGSPSPAATPLSVVLQGSSASRAAQSSRAQKRLPVTDNSREIQAPELQGAELEFLLKKQLELVSRA